MREYSNINDSYCYDEDDRLVKFEAFNEEEAVKNASRIISKMTNKPRCNRDVDYATMTFEFRMHELLDFQLLCRREILEPLIYLAKAKKYPKGYVSGKKKDDKKKRLEDKKRKELKEKV